MPEDQIRQLERALELSENTDVIMNPILGTAIAVLVPVVSASVSIMLVVGIAKVNGLSWSSVGGIALMIGLVVFFTSFLAVNTALFYILIKRRNEHFQRSTQMFRALSELLYYLGYISNEHYIATRIKVRRIEELGHLDEVLWLFLGVITFGLTNLYVSYRILRDFYLHELEESAIVSILFGKLDTYTQFSRKIPNKNFELYAIISIMFPILYLYLIYMLIKYPNEHFIEHREFERKLVEKLSE